jgi:hypothetical protein
MSVLLQTRASTSTGQITSVVQFSRVDSNETVCALYPIDWSVWFAKCNMTKDSLVVAVRHLQVGTEIGNEHIVQILYGTFLLYIKNYKHGDSENLKTTSKY